ncbi:uncharacterized protein F5Z01DRAFT_63517 [Emericellopsis atlantica]|uniref:Uncharacterized protein n=1 Tax=Emericellopsis atlantica TaxID=2614577 RepID=A0A9P7ZN41_9HYPO|nr:uncharacterized protein F5Z01DRAFT_63517 [Emericellopsis atlantica]KAG9254981.1 hypothetical protein F5Z01DRAFT_63517 [Emericellopsis atlantica]
MPIHSKCLTYGRSKSRVERCAGKRRTWMDLSRSPVSTTTIHKSFEATQQALAAPVPPPFAPKPYIRRRRAASVRAGGRSVSRAVVDLAGPIRRGRARHPVSFSPSLSAPTSIHLDSSPPHHASPASDKVTSSSIHRCHPRAEPLAVRSQPALGDRRAHPIHWLLARPPAAVTSAYQLSKVCSDRGDAAQHLNSSRCHCHRFYEDTVQ